MSCLINNQFIKCDIGYLPVKESAAKNIVIPKANTKMFVQEWEYPDLAITGMTNLDTLIFTGTTAIIFTNNDELNSSTVFNAAINYLTGITSVYYLTIAPYTINFIHNLTELDDSGDDLDFTLDVIGNYKYFYADFRYSIYSFDRGIQEFNNEVLTDIIYENDFGVELIQNGGFDDGISGWTANGDYGISDGKLYIGYSGETSVSQLVTLQSGNTYVLKFDVSDYTKRDPFIFASTISFDDITTSGVCSTVDGVVFIDENYNLTPTWSINKNPFKNGHQVGIFSVASQSSTANTLSIVPYYASYYVDNFSLKKLYDFRKTTSLATSGFSYMGPGNEYMLKPSYIFSGQTLPFGYTKTFDTQLLAGVTGDTYGIYDTNNDWYFITVTNPTSPEFILPEITTSKATIETEQLSIASTGQTPFLLYKSAAEIISVSVNGVTLLGPTNVDFLDDLLRLNSDPFTDPDFIDIDYYFNSNKLYLNPNKTIITSTNDVLVANYIVDPFMSRFRVENYRISTIPSGTTQSGDNKILFNTSCLQYEYFLDSAPINAESITLFHNGLQLVNGKDFYQSGSLTDKLTFHTLDLSTGDTISLYYEGNEDILVTTSGVTVNFTSKIDSDNGIYIIQITTNDDTEFNNVSGTTVITYSQLNGEDVSDIVVGDSYTYEVFLPMSFIETEQTYLARIINLKSFTTINYGKVITGSISDTIRFRAKNKSIYRCN